MEKIRFSYRSFNFTTSTLDWVEIWFGLDGDFDEK